MKPFLPRGFTDVMKVRNLFFGRGIGFKNIDPNPFELALSFFGKKNNFSIIDGASIPNALRQKALEERPSWLDCLRTSINIVFQTPSFQRFPSQRMGDRTPQGESTDNRQRNRQYTNDRKL